MVERLRTAELIDLGREEFRRLQMRRTIEDEQLVEGSLGCSLCARAVVADDVVDQRFSEDLEVPRACRSSVRRDGRRAPGTPANTSICRARIGFSRVWHLIPGRNLIGAGRQLGVWRYDAELLLTREDLFSQHVPTAVEGAPVLLDPFLGHLMGRVSGARVRST